MPLSAVINHSFLSFIYFYSVYYQLNRLNYECKCHYSVELLNNGVRVYRQSGEMFSIFIRGNHRVNKPHSRHVSEDGAGLYVVCQDK